MERWKELAAGEIERTLNRLPHKVIVNCERDPYLYRWYLLRTKWIAVFIHKFVRSDEDRALHDHPWSFLVVPIWRGYIEHNQAGRRRVRPLIGTRFRRAEYRHRVELIQRKPAWSVFFRFKERRTWGFWVSGAFVAWNHWWQDKCE